MENETAPLIFIVEDNTVYNKLLASHLRAHKYTRIECYFSGEECLKNIDHKPDIVIQDYLLDGMSGIDVLKEVKKKYPDTQFIFLSSQDNVEIAINSMKYGAYDYIIKDQQALGKLLTKINKLLSDKVNVVTKRSFSVFVRNFFITLVIIIAIVFALARLFPRTFSIIGI